MKILVVEDSDRLRDSLYEGLCRSGFTVDLAADGAAGIHQALTNQYDVVVLDIMLPKKDGLTVLAEIRDTDVETQVLMLTARDRVEDRVRGLELGADDYLVKPFAFEELVARLRTLGRRRHRINKPTIAVGNLTINTSLCQVAVENEPLVLSPSEYTVLEYLALCRGRVVSKLQLREQLNDSESHVVSNVIEVLISNLRKKLREAGVIDVVQTKRGFGYYVDEESEPQP